MWSGAWSAAAALSAVALLQGCSGGPGGVAVLNEMESVGKQVQELSREQEKLEEERRKKESELQRKLVHFSVRGRIMDREENAVYLFGIAIPSNGDWNHLGALYVRGEGNIAILNPRPLARRDYYADSPVYFVNKTTGLNAFGVSVPVRVYSTEIPPEAKLVQAEIGKLNERVLELSNRIAELNNRREALYAKWKEEHFLRARDHPQEMMKFGEALKARNDLHAAAQAYRRVIELAPDHLEARVALAELYREQGDADRAIAECRVALAANPRHKAALRVLAYTLLESKKDAQEAAKVFREYLAVARPDIDDPEYALARIELERISAGSDGFVSDGAREAVIRARWRPAPWRRKGGLF